MKTANNLKSGFKVIALTNVAATVCAIGAVWADTAQAADSTRLLWATNGHYYQRFEGSPITWPNAKTACESKSAHLVTITSDKEQGFIYDKFLAGQGERNWYHIGGTSNDTYAWTWLTGENFNAYANWDTSTYQSGWPRHNTGRKYIGILVRYDFDNYSDQWGRWVNVYADWNATGYICEWSTNQHIGSAIVPDMNGNGIDEVAVLFVNYKNGQHTVNIKDPSTKALLKTIVFNTNFVPPSGLVALKDTNGNKAPEIGVLFTQYGFPSVQIKDTLTGAKLRDISFMNPGFAPKSIAASQDTNLSGANDIVVIGINKSSGAPLAEVRDSKTGNLAYSVNF